MQLTGIKKYNTIIVFKIGFLDGNVWVPAFGLSRDKNELEHYMFRKGIRRSTMEKNW